MRPVMLRGSVRSVDCSCLLGGLAVEPLLLESLRSGTTMLFSLLTDRRFHSSVCLGDPFELKGLSRMFVVCLSSLSFGGGGGFWSISESMALTESFVSLLLLSDRLRDSPGLSEYTDERLRMDGGLGGCPPTGRRGIVFAGTLASLGSGGSGEYPEDDIIALDSSFSADGPGATGSALENRLRPL